MKPIKSLVNKERETKTRMKLFSINTAYAINFPWRNRAELADVIDFSPEIGSLDRVIPSTIRLLITSVDHSQIRRHSTTRILPSNPMPKNFEQAESTCFGMQTRSFVWTRACNHVDYASDRRNRGAINETNYGW